MNESLWLTHPFNRDLQKGQWSFGLGKCGRMVVKRAKVVWMMEWTSHQDIYIYIYGYIYTSQLKYLGISQSYSIHDEARKIAKDCNIYAIQASSIRRTKSISCMKYALLVISYATDTVKNKKKIKQRKCHGKAIFSMTILPLTDSWGSWHCKILAVAGKSWTERQN